MERYEAVELEWWEERGLLWAAVRDTCTSDYICYCILNEDAEQIAAALNAVDKTDAE